MRLQVQRLRGPNEIIIGENQQGRLNNFTIEFNRPIEDDDSDTIVAIRIYDNEGEEIAEYSYTIQNIVENTNNFRLSGNRLNNVRDVLHLRLEEDDLECLTGSHIYIHALIRNDSENAQNISLNINRFHETIKKVYLAADRRINYVYWSSYERIADRNEALTEIATNDHVFIHIQAQGMYNDNASVVILVRENGQDRRLAQLPTATLSRNKKVIAVSVEDIRTRYRTQLRGDDSTPFEIVVRAQPFQRIQPWSPWRRDEPDEVPESIESGLLRVAPLADDAPPPQRATSTGTVFVNVNNAPDRDSIEEVTPTQFTDFKIGYMGHLEGVGTLEEDASPNRTTYVTVYPLKFYPIMVSDLVKTNIITIEDAILLGPPNEDADELSDNFSKLSAPITGNRQLITLFETSDDRRINRGRVRELLAQVRNRNATREFAMCRDAWQLRRGTDNYWERQPEGRYNQHKESPPGEFFLNWVVGRLHRVFISLRARDNIVDQYPGRRISIDPQRAGLALHNGGSWNSVGCINFNIHGTGNLWNLDFQGWIYPRSTNNSYLNLMCIDERNATQILDDYQRVNRVSRYFWRFYDLVRP